MTTFEGGPATGHTLMLRRAPKLLRVVESNGKFDALDQLHDEPRQGEKIYAYEITGKPGMIHINCGRQGGGFYTLSAYRFITPQPADSDMRTNPAWGAWCLKKWNAR
jgi:hypothetical protein